jgi:transcriptional regulator with XRE-family HTH domain
MDAELAARLGRNLKQLREARGVTQAQMAKVADVPRATWANLESGTANPTLSVLDRVAGALQVTLEELVAIPRAAAQLYRRGALPVRQRGDATVFKLLPDAVPGMEIASSSRSATSSPSEVTRGTPTPTRARAPRWGSRSWRLLRHSPCRRSRRQN